MCVCIYRSIINLSLPLEIYFICKRKLFVWQPKNTFCHPPTSMFLSFPHPLLALAVCYKFSICFATTKGSSHHLYPSSFRGWAADFGIPPNWQNILHHITGCFTRTLPWLAPAASDTQQLLGQLQPALLISKPSTVKLCMLVSSWFCHGHLRPLICCHNPRHLLYLLWTSETKSWFKFPYSTFILELFPFLISLSHSLLCKTWAAVSLGVTSIE